MYKHNILIDLMFDVFIVKKIDTKKFVKALGDVSQDLNILTFRLKCLFKY